MTEKIGELIRFAIEGIAGQAAAVWSVFLITDIFKIEEEKWYTITIFYPDTTFVSDVGYFAIKILLTATLCFLIVTAVQKFFALFRRRRVEA